MWMMPMHLHVNQNSDMIIISFWIPSLLSYVSICSCHITLKWGLNDVDDATAPAY